MTGGSDSILIALLGGLGQPICGFLLVAGNLLTSKVQLAQHILGVGISSLCRLGKPLHRSCGILLDGLHQLQHFPPHLPHQLISGIRLLFVEMEHFVAENIVGELGLDLTDALFGEVGLSRLCGPGHHVDVRVLALVVKGGVPAEVTGRYLRRCVV